ncbi:hypothetical protein QUF58_02675 [Anaerolineales bacterium HSG24]|nr:hypothetical protein [Anaerolineales bacterium HSG24]
MSRLTLIAGIYKDDMADSEPCPEMCILFILRQIFLGSNWRVKNG